MLSKAIISLLVSLHLISPSAGASIQNPPSNVDNPPELKVTGSGDGKSVTLPEAVYADLALQHELDHMSVYYFDNNADNTVSLNAEKIWVPASTIKLFVAMYAFDQAANGKISLDEAVTIDPNNVAASLSDPNGYPPLNAGESVSVYRLLDQMITQSDNTAYNTLLDLLDRQEITKYLSDLGLVDSKVGSKLNLNESQQQAEIGVAGYGDNTTTADDYAKAFILIRGGRIPGATSLFGILARQKLNTMIPAYLPKDIIVAHKTGELDPYYHDGGIVVDSNRRYVLSIFSDLGNPSVVAHESYLIYTKDLNAVGNNLSPINTKTGQVPNAPIDPLVLGGSLEDVPGVLAASTTNIKAPAVTASDLGITASDLSTALSPRQLPFSLVPADSQLASLVDLGSKISLALNPIPNLRVVEETGYQKLKLAQANDLINRGKKDEADAIISQVDSSVVRIAKDPVIRSNASLQSAVDQVSETRFTILANELSKTDESTKVEVIKEIAKQAVNTEEKVKPFVPQAVIAKDLSAAPVVGQVVRVSSSSITVKTGSGEEVTTPTDQTIKTRSANSEDTSLQNPTSIAVGSTVALAGIAPGSDKPSFILTNIAADSANPSPVTVIKVNKETNSMVVAKNGVPVQIDLTADSIIKGSDTAISLGELRPGDIIVVHGRDISSSSASGELLPSSSPGTSGVPESGSGGNENGNGGGSNSSSGGLTPTSFPGATIIPGTLPAGSPLATLLPTGSLKPNPTTSTTQTGTKTATPSSANQNKTPVPATAKPGSTQVPKATPVPTKGPQVIQGNVIQVVQTTTKTPAPAPSTPKPGSSNSTNPPSTPAPTAKPK